MYINCLQGQILIMSINEIHDIMYIISLACKAEFVCFIECVKQMILRLFVKTAFLVKYVWNTNIGIVYNYYVKTSRNFLYC